MTLDQFMPKFIVGLGIGGEGIKPENPSAQLSAYEPSKQISHTIFSIQLN